MHFLYVLKSGLEDAIVSIPKTKIALQYQEIALNVATFNLRHFHFSLGATILNEVQKSRIELNDLFFSSSGNISQRKTILGEAISFINILAKFELCFQITNTTWRVCLTTWIFSMISAHKKIG
jgi:hypothetical protein